MPGIPAKCLECGTDLRYDAPTMVFFCPACQPIETREKEQVRESRKEAA